MSVRSTVVPGMTLVTIPPVGGGLDADDALPWLIDLGVFETAIANTNWDTVTQSAFSLHNGWKESSSAQNAEISWDVVLSVGTWTVEMLYTRDTANGIITVLFGSDSKGTIDTYGASANNLLGSVSGIAVATTAKYRLTLKMATKNGSASAYTGEIVHVQLRRTT